LPLARALDVRSPAEERGRGEERNKERAPRTYEQRLTPASQREEGSHEGERPEQDVYAVGNLAQQQIGNHAEPERRREDTQAEPRLALASPRRNR
jgi:hypothetical protein